MVARLFLAAVTLAAVGIASAAEAVPVRFEGDHYEIAIAADAIPPAIDHDDVLVGGWNMAAHARILFAVAGQFATIRSEAESDFLKALVDRTVDGLGSFALGPWSSGFLDTGRDLSN